MVRQRCLGKGVEAPELETVKDFLCFHISTSRGKFVVQPTVDSVNAFAEWFFAGFTQATETLREPAALLQNPLLSTPASYYATQVATARSKVVWIGEPVGNR